ncbi:MAG: hypothetical protein CMM52_12940 [Rhodospirillaceae bacterium]|nr:hypothetical protein [Rhodospirillaceae bacterium]|tara:strand:+ start:18471 stop:19649 length:1179 start_codon:yes stop_codon:yes gene_type:complete
MQRVLSNFGLFTASLLIGAVFIEIFTVRFLLPKLPLRLHHHFGALSVLAQPTKNGVLPKNYTLLLGDSFAHGLGDWLFTADHGTNAKFHSLHVIRDLTGWDIVIMGRGGSGSPASLVGQPLYSFTEINASPYLELEPPSRIIAYFYEGNDLNNNTTKGDNDDIEAEISDARRRIGYEIKTIKPWFFWITGVLRIARHNFKVAMGWTKPSLIGYPPADSWRTWKSGPNKLKLEDREIFAPPLQGPSPLLSEKTINDGVEVFYKSLENLRNRFPRSKVFVAYIPSVMTSYRHAGEVGIAHIQVRGRPKRPIPIKFMEERSDRICGLILEASIRAGARFIDVRPSIWEATKSDILHGPRDASHFNKLGYEVLGKTVVDAIQRDGTQKSCTRLDRK